MLLCFKIKKIAQQKAQRDAKFAVPFNLSVENSPRIGDVIAEFGRRCPQAEQFRARLFDDIVWIDVGGLFAFGFGFFNRAWHPGVKPSSNGL